MKKIIFAAASLLFASSAFAHHPLGGLPMETLAHGLLSGVGHPVLGFDHLFFVVIIGIAATFTGRRFAAPGAYILAMLAGCLLVSFGFALPAQEAVIGLSLLVVGGVVLSGKALGMASALLLFAGFGLFHGAAFGQTIAAQETAAGTSVLIGYLAGLGLIQYLIALGAGWLSRNTWKAVNASALQPRLAGAMVAGVGLFLTLENVEGPVLRLITG